MKYTRPTETNDSVTNNNELTDQRDLIPRSKLLSGSVINKYPVVLDDGRTTIFISDLSKESEARKNYAMRQGNRLMQFSKKAK